MNTASKLSLTVVALLALGATAAQAQGVSNTIVATATVQTPLTVTGTTTLDFGNVFPGVAKTIAPSAVTAGKFTVGGQANAEVNMVVAPPTDLVGPGGALLAIGSWLGGYDTDNTQGSQTGLTLAGTTDRLDATTGALYVWLGATVTPTAGQVAGTYNANVQLTVAYTGL
jgi:hypothetical protein